MIDSEPLFEFETFGVALGGAILCGALSTVLPMLIAPTATLAALAVAGWVALRRKRGSLSWRILGWRPAIAFVVLAGATFGFLAPPVPLAPFRGLLLAGGLMPLFVVERLHVRPRSPEYSQP